jgi:hypothetical protein
VSHEGPTPRGRPSWQSRHLGLIVGLVVLVSVIGAVAVYAATRPCVQTGEERSSNSCPLPPYYNPPPSIIIDNGTTYTIASGQYEYFQFQPSPDTYAELAGSFVATHLVEVYVMNPTNFSEFSRVGAAKFSCLSADYECFSTGVDLSGSVNISFLPIYRSEWNASYIVPWFLVMQNMNSALATNITWVSSLVATYIGITLTIPTPIYTALLNSPL